MGILGQEGSEKDEEGITYQVRLNNVVVDNLLQHTQIATVRGARLVYVEARDNVPQRNLQGVCVTVLVEGSLDDESVDGHADVKLINQDVVVLEEGVRGIGAPHVAEHREVRDGGLVGAVGVGDVGSGSNQVGRGRGTNKLDLALFVGGREVSTNNKEVARRPR